MSNIYSRWLYALFLHYFTSVFVIPHFICRHAQFPNRTLQTNFYSELNPFSYLQMNLIQHPARSPPRIAKKKTMTFLNGAHSLRKHVHELTHATCPYTDTI
jgi:hypothetical protein